MRQRRSRAVRVPCLLIDNGLNGAIGVVEQALHLQGTQMGNIVGGYTVVIQQIPLPLKLYDAVVSCPTHYGLQNHTLIGEGAVRVIANGIAEQVTVAGRIREVVLTLILVHPRSFEETVRVARLQRLAVPAQDYHWAWSLCELQHIIGHSCHIAAKCRHIGRSPEFCLLVRSMTYIYISCRSRHGIGLLNGSHTQGHMPLQLTAP